MDKFFLGIVTGLGSLVVPLLLSSLFLPGPAGTSLRPTNTDAIEARAPQLTPEQTQPVTPEQTPEKPPSATQKIPPAKPVLVAYDIPHLGIAIDLPDSWDVVKGPGFTGKDTGRRINDVLTIFRKDHLSQTAPYHLRLAQGDGPMLDVRIPIGVGLKRLALNNPDAEITKEPGFESLGPFDGGRGTVRLTHQIDDQLVRLDSDIWILKNGDGWLSLTTTVSDADSQESELVRKVIGSLRKI